jgi:hypothetical protein
LLRCDGQDKAIGEPTPPTSKGSDEWRIYIIIEQIRWLLDLTIVIEDAINGEDAINAMKQLHL